MPSKRDAMTARALALVGCGYIYGATGWICTRARMEQQMRQYPTYAGQIERYGKKWLGKPCYDCAQLTRDIARRAGVRLPSGATSQSSIVFSTPSRPIKSDSAYPLSL